MLPTIQNKDFLPFQFEGMRLQEACFIDGNPYFTARAIGEFLEYVKPRPDIAINKIVDRNPHILKFSTDTNLVSVEGKRKVTREIRIYDPIGLQLIINKSNQPKAVAFQIAAANLVLAFMQGKVKPKVWSSDRVAAIKQILSYPATHKRKELILDLAEREGVNYKRVYNWVRKFGTLPTHTAAKKKTRADAGTTIYPDLKAAALFVKSQMPGYGPQRIAAILGRPGFKDNIKRWLKAA